MPIRTRNILTVTVTLIFVQAIAAPAEAGFFRRALVGSAVGVGGAIALSYAAKRAIECSRDLDRCPGEKALAGKIAKAIEAKTPYGEVDQALVLSQGMKPPPKDLEGFPGSTRAKPKTPFAGGLRRRWNLAKGGFADWDYQHGEVEVYNDRGEHKGAFDPKTGAQIKPRDPRKSAPK